MLNDRQTRPFVKLSGDSPARQFSATTSHRLTTIFFLTAFFSVTIGLAQTDTLAKQNSLLKQLHKAQRVESEGIGIAGAPSDNYKIANHCGTFPQSQH
jgi:hypothetical protein